MVVAMMVLLVLAGLGLVALRMVRMEVAASGYLRESRSALHVAESGLMITAGFTTQQPEYFHRAALAANPAAPTFTFPQGRIGNSADPARLGTLDYLAVMSRPRLGLTPALFQVGGSSANRFVFYIYQVDVVGTVNGDPVTRAAAPGGGSAVKQLRADVRIGPIMLNQ